jgi:hypothetical protein
VKTKIDLYLSLLGLDLALYPEPVEGLISGQVAGRSLSQISTATLNNQTIQLSAIY